jgi:hypothetical protein
MSVTTLWTVKIDFLIGWMGWIHAVSSKYGRLTKKPPVRSHLTLNGVSTGLLVGRRGVSPLGVSLLTRMLEP